MADLGEGCGGHKLHTPPSFEWKILPKRVIIRTASPFPHQKFLDPPMYTQKIDIRRKYERILGLLSTLLQSKCN